ncbi:alpha,alpha-trehalose-phosphate synthase [UDP-forming] 1 [Cannabis sativa]|uniref:alpha,alpha-trehalose-phosphate synthase [UDP-forming] 1 n=1 Tax=Cannabis sativa TaxID=3483 RepID=UPI0029CAA75B|nr:alpha,alpha-trehalose-phosphate synthase [UDP-forming] 1 [Cannabis sativa]
MSGNKYSGLTRLERLMRERELRKSINSNEEAKDGSRQRLLVVANRLPFSAIRKGEEQWQLKMDAESFVTALQEFDVRWIGWADVNVPDETGKIALTKALAEKRCIPVFLDEAIVHQYNNGYCENILWPLFHYLEDPQEGLATNHNYQAQFDAYKKVNKMFADVVNEHYEEGDVVWCHDYQLMLLPEYLKRHNYNMKVGWFLHTPFPSLEIYRTLASRSELLRSVLAADLVGFYTYDYSTNFTSTCAHILGLEVTPKGLEDRGKLTRVAVVPTGIDPDQFVRVLEIPQVQEDMKKLKESLAGRKMILGFDKLDMMKGIPQQFSAFKKFLEENPSWRGKVVLLQISVPTRTDVPEYQKLPSQVHEIVGHINRSIGTPVPIIHLEQMLDYHTMCTLNAVADVALVIPCREGTNLECYKFVALQESNKGVLILSKCAGAVNSLGAGAILVNPLDITEVAASIGDALTMIAKEREMRHQHNFKHVTSHSSQQWAATFVRKLNETIVEAQRRTRQFPLLLPMKEVVDRYSESSNRLLILGFDATLTEPIGALGRRGGQIKEMERKLHPDLKELLKKLSEDPKTTVVVLSGSDRNILDHNFSDYNMWLAAEYGMFLRHTGGEWMTTMPEKLNTKWDESVKRVFEYFTERTPRSHFEIRETSLVWNYKYADIQFGNLQAKNLLQHLCTGPISNASVNVVRGSRTVEVRAVGVTKGATIGRILHEIVHNKCIRFDYVLCIGHFLSKDEDLYGYFERQLQSKMPTKTSLHKDSSVLDLKGDNYFSCSVDLNGSSARYQLVSSDDVVTLLKKLP